MDSLTQFTLDDFTTPEESNAASKTEVTEEIKTESAESTTEPKTEEPAKEASSKEGDNSGAESPKAEEYTPDFSYSVKDDKREFPEWIREVVKTKEDEVAVRDLLTRADALDGLKESRDRVESEFSEYRQNFENKIVPTLQVIDEFDRANASLDFGKAWELSNVNPKDIVDYMLHDKDLSELVYQKVLDQINMQEQGGPQATAAQQQAWQASKEKKSLELQNRELEARLESIERNNFNQALDFAIAQNQNAVSLYEQRNGQGSFRKFVDDYSFMQKSRGNNLSPIDSVNQSLQMLGLSSQVAPAQTSGTHETVNTQAKVQPQATRQPEVIPNLGTGSNVSMVQETPTTWDAWKKSFGSDAMF